MKTESYWEVCWENEDGGSSSVRFGLDDFESAVDETMNLRCKEPDKTYVLMMVSRVDIKF